MNKKVVRQLIAAAAVISFALPVYAAEDVSYDVEEIIVTAKAYQPAMSTDMVNVKVVSPNQAVSVPDLLRQVSGLDIQMRSKFGDNQDGTVKLRGSDARRFTVLIDGHQVNMSGVMGGSYFDWNSIPLDNVDKIQIIKGAKAAQYGNTIGGVINIITKKTEKPGGEMLVSAGENGQYQYIVNYHGSDQNLAWNVYGNKSGADAFLRNNSYDAKQYGVGLKYSLSASDTFKFDINRSEAKRGMIIQNEPGVAGYDPAYPTISKNNADSFVGNAAANSGDYWKKYFTNYTMGWQHKGEHNTTELNYWHNNEKRHEVHYNADGTLNFNRTVVADKSSGWQLASEQKINNNTKLGYGVEYKQMRYGYGWYDVGTGTALYPSQKADVWGSYLDYTKKLDDRWTGNFGLRYDKMSGRPDANPDMRSVDYDALSPKLNFSFKNDKATTTFISVNRIWRAPSMAEYYWWSQNYNNKIPPVIGDGLDLKPEKGWGYELGVEKKVGKAYTTKLTSFYQDLDDYINFTHMWPFSCYNISQAKIWGFEWENTYRLNAASQIFLNYTNQHTKKSGVDPSDKLGLRNELDYRPQHKAVLGYQYDFKPWQVRYTINYTGTQTANYPYGSTSRVSLGGYTVHNLSVGYELNQDATVVVSVDNLLNKDYVEQYGYPMPGRLFNITYKQKI